MAIFLLALGAVLIDPVVATPARRLPGFTVSEDDYPPAALKQDATGVVGFEVTVDPYGAPAHCVITGSLSPAFDEKTCAIVIARMHFAPARDSAGIAVATTYRSHIRWMIDSSSPFVTMSATIGWPVDGGKFGKCRSQLVGFDKADPLNCADFDNATVAALVDHPLTNYSGVELRIVLITDPSFVPAGTLTDGGQLLKAVSARFTLTPDGKVDQCVVSSPPTTIPQAPQLCAFLKDGNVSFPAAPTTPARAGVLGFYIYAVPRSPAQ